VLDALSDPTREETVLMASAQVGKTLMLKAVLGYFIDQDPSPILVVQPTLEIGEAFSKDRLAPMVRDTPRLRGKIADPKSRNSGNTILHKVFPGGHLTIAGANSPASLASMPIRYVLCDEVDRFPWEVGQEGDPLGLIDERTKTFPRRKVLLVSTPTVKGSSRIEGEYEKSDMRQYHVPCPHCGDYQVLRWRHDDGRYGLIHNDATGAVYYACRECGERIDEHHKPAMLAAGRWIPRHPERAVRGYHLSGLYSPIGLGFTWAELWRKWEEAHGDTANLKRFINTTLGESWEEQGDSIEDLALIARLEAAEAAMQWRPIEEAPKDGKTRILGCGLYNHPFDPAMAESVVFAWVHFNRILGEWVDCHGYYFTPTHYMPLPAPPEDGK